MTTNTNATVAPLALVGNSLSVLVTATERAYRGLQTTIINPGGPLGGYFAGVHALGRLHDAGTVLYEFTPPSEPGVIARLGSYDPMKYDDVSRFGQVVRRFVLAHQHTQAIAAPLMWADNQLLPDMLFGHDPSAVTRLSNSAAIHRELSALSRHVRADAHLWHPANHQTWPLDGTPPADWLHSQGARSFDIDTLSRTVHGRALHETVFAPFAHQLLNRDAAHLAARYHSVPWLPFFEPETLMAARDNQSRMPRPSRYHYPEKGSIAALTQQLATLVRHTPSIRLIEDEVRHLSRNSQSFVIETAKHGAIAADRLGWSLAPGKAIELLGERTTPVKPERLSLMLGFIKLSIDALEQHFSVVHAAARDTGIYRVFNSTLCGAPAEAGFVHLVVEANPQRFAAFHGSSIDKALVLRDMLIDLHTMGLVRANAQATAFELHRLDRALPLPTQASVSAMLFERERLLHLLPGVELLGAAAGPFANTLSDQIVQGLQMAHSRRGRLDQYARPEVPNMRELAYAVAAQTPFTTIDPDQAESLATAEFG